VSSDVDGAEGESDPGTSARCDESSIKHDLECKHVERTLQNHMLQYGEISDV
jgi:hypothetical protein